MGRHALVPIERHADERGSLRVIDSTDAFDVRRVYVLSDVPEGAVRGGHAHREHLGILVPLVGSFTVVVDDGEQESEYVLDDPTRGLFLGRMVWRELRNFSAGAVGLIASSHSYDPDDYIHGRAEFRAEYAAEIVVLMHM